MTQEDKDLLLKNLCPRLPYGVKILHTGWDYDSDTDFETVETLIGIDDKFIYTVWDKTGDREKHCLSVSNWKPYLRPMSSMTEEEKREYDSLCDAMPTYRYEFGDIVEYVVLYDNFVSIDWLNAHHFDYRGIIERGLAIEAPEGMYNIKKQ